MNSLAHHRDSVNIEENQPVGFPVMDVGSLARSRLHVRAQQTPFTLELSNGEHGKYFELVNTTKLRVARIIDREALCPSSTATACELTPSVVIRDGTDAQCSVLSVHCYLCWFLLCG